jgi:hypothetical protein
VPITVGDGCRPRPLPWRADWAVSVPKCHLRARHVSRYRRCSRVCAANHCAQPSSSPFAGQAFGCIPVRPGFTPAPFNAGANLGAGTLQSPRSLTAHQLQRRPSPEEPEGEREERTSDRAHDRDPPDNLAPTRCCEINVGHLALPFGRSVRRPSALQRECQCASARNCWWRTAACTSVVQSAYAEVVLIVQKLCNQLMDDSDVAVLYDIHVMEGGPTDGGGGARRGLGTPIFSSPHSAHNYPPHRERDVGCASKMAEVPIFDARKNKEAPAPGLTPSRRHGRLGPTALDGEALMRALP